jgi:hypothetical protein
MGNSLEPIDLKDALVFAELVRTYLYAIAFVIFIAAIVMIGIQSSGDSKAIFFGIVKIGVLVGLMVFVPPYYNQAGGFMTRLSITIADESLEGATLNSQVDECLLGLNNQEIEESGLSSWFGTIVKTLGEWTVDILIWLSRLFRLVVRAVQQVLLLILVAVSPIMFSFGALSETQSLFISYLMNTTAIILWGIGFVLADLVIYAGTKWIVGFIAISLTGSGATAAGAAYVVGGPVSLSVLIAMCACMLGLVISMNVLGPLVITSLLNGKSPAGAAVQSARMGMQFSNALANLSKSVNTPVDRDHQKGGRTALSSGASAIKGMAMGAGGFAGAAVGAGGSPGLFRAGGFENAVQAYSSASGKSSSPTDSGTSHGDGDIKNINPGNSVVSPPSESGASDVGSDESGGNSPESRSSDSAVSSASSIQSAGENISSGTSEINASHSGEGSGNTLLSPEGKASSNSSGSAVMSVSASAETSNKQKGAEEKGTGTFTEESGVGAIASDPAAPSSSDSGKPEVNLEEADFFQSSLDGIKKPEGDFKVAGGPIQNQDQDQDPAFQTGSLGDLRNMSKEDLHSYKGDK